MQLEHTIKTLDDQSLDIAFYLENHPFLRELRSSVEAEYKVIASSVKSPGLNISCQILILYTITTEQ
jgi:hypothetical protein